MSFAEKLDLIMNITKTTNSNLSMYISLDASLISRFRSGKRVPSNKGNYLQKIATYFARHVASDYQKAALCEVLNIALKSFPKDEKKIAELIYQWFLDQNASTDNSAVNGFIDSFANFQFKKMPQMPVIEGLPDMAACVGEHTVLYGAQGKQYLVLTFLSLIIRNIKPQTLLLFSDEDFSWLADDHVFAAKWKALMVEVIKSGNKIKIIHTVNRRYRAILLP